METIRNYYELSQPQKSIWYLEQKYPGISMNIVAGNLRLKGDIDYPAFIQAIKLFIKNNEGLHIHFSENDGEVRQYAVPYEENDIDFFDFSQSGGFDALYKWDEAQTKIPFPLIDSDLFYFAVFKIDEQTGGTYAKLHHLISDAWTMSIYGNEIMAYYSAIKEGKSFEDKPWPSFFEHLESEKKYEVSQRFVQDREYWNSKFETCPDTSVLKPQALQTDSIVSKRKTFVLPEKLSGLIWKSRSESNASVFTMFMSALSLYIYRTTGNDDIVLGTTTLNRINAREKATVGMFVSVAAPMRIRIDDSWSFGELSEAMSRECLSVLKHQKYPYNYLLRDLNKKHRLTNRLYDIVLNYQNTKIKGEGFETRWHFQGYQVESLIIHVNDRDDSGKFVINYDFLTDVYDVREIEELHHHVISLLWHAMDNPGKPVSRLEMLSEKEKYRILNIFNDTTAYFPREKTLHEFLYAQAEKTPDYVAVICGDKRMTYREVNEKSNQLARVLRDKGVCEDTVVGISLFRSFEMIIGIMAILKAGGAYLPMDPDYPRDRIEYMMRDSSSRILLTTGALAERFLFETDVLCVDDDSCYSGDASDLGNTSGPDSLAYIIYTSGSTGKPKGVMVQHAGVINRLSWGSKKFPLCESDVMLQKTPFTFDVSVWELFWWTFAGASVCMLEPGGEKEPESILKTVEDNHITFIHFVPSMLNAFLSYVEKKGCASRLSSAKTFFASGEALTVRLTDAFNRLLNVPFGSRLFNLYGPTEATVEVSCFDCSPRVTLKTVPIGKPIDNIRLYVMDKDRNLMPIGVPGELYIGGVGVARGYINNPVLTAEKFVDDPFFPGEKIYRTGDRVRWFPKGDIEYLGRIDFQIKIRGFRIELGEIESRLLQHEAIREAVVVSKKHNDDSYLCAYITTKKAVQISEVKEHLSKDLPEYMVPAFFVHLDELPLSPNGKADRKALPSPDFSHIIRTTYEAPVNETEEALSKIWRQILDIREVGVTENFFQIGGDSLHAIALVSEVHRTFDVDMPVSEIFRLKTIRRMAEVVSESDKDKYCPIPVLDSMQHYAMSSAQKRQFVLNRLDDTDMSYNLPGVMRIEGTIDPDRLESAFRKLIERHESLRTSFSLENGIPLQRIHDAAEFAVERISADGRSIDEIMREFVRPFDFSRPPLLRVGLLTQDDGSQFMLFDMHHIISDGASINILIRDFAALYSGKALRELKIQYRDYTAWQKNQLQGESAGVMEKYWLSQLGGEQPVLDMPTDYPRPPRRSCKGSRISYILNAEISRELKRLAQETDTTLCMVMLSAYYVLLSKYSSQEDITVGMPVEGRLHPDVKDLIGMFVNTVAIRSFPEASKSFVVFLREVKAVLLSAYENQAYPFEELVDKLNIKRDLGRNPLFDTVFILQNMHLEKMELDRARLTPAAFNSGTAKFDITFEAVDKGDFIELNAEYCTDLFRESTVKGILLHYKNILKSIILNPEMAISEINLLTHDEKKRLAFDFNCTDAQYPGKMTIQQLFEEQVHQTPERIAVCFGSENITYRELNIRANRLARIMRDKGVGPDDIVAICVRRSIDMIAGMIGILKAGGAYLPMDPDNPIERNRFILEDSGAKMLLTQMEFAEVWPEGTNLLTFDDLRVAEQDAADLTIINKPEDLAYIIYTSGSTGKPKGVMIEHVNVVRLLFNDKFQYSFSCEDVWSMFHSYTFDFSVWEMYGALLYGGRLVIVSKDDAKDTERFFKILQSEKVTVLNQTPGAFYNLIQEDISSGIDSFSPRYVIFGGEALKPRMLKPYREKHPETKLVNMYGITETTVHVTYKEIGREEIDNNISNVGKPIPTLKTYVLDRNLKLQPIGVPGELCVSGAGVGRGYLHNPDLTGRKFIPNPFCNGERLYRSGDLARICENGDIEYLGRIDSQVKIRGFRIELGEIESDLLKDGRIREAVVVPRENRFGEKSLYAYYVSDKQIDLDELRSGLKKYLPDYMIPSIFVHMDKMPLNRNGKVDRGSLPQKDEAVKQADYVGPKSAVEKKIAKVWASVLELSRAGVTENFFDLGGDSLSAIRVISQLSEMGMTLTMADLYSNPTIEQLAYKVESENEPESGKLLIRLTSARKESNVNIVCFPYGGGSAITFKSLADAFSGISDDYSLYAVNIPGHDIGGQDALLPVEETARSVFQEIRERLTGKTVLYGHCVGNAVLLETARLIEENGLKIEAVYFGAIIPPKNVQLYGNIFDPWKFSTDAGIIEYLSRIGLPEGAIGRESADQIIRAFRHDAKCFYRYFCWSRRKNATHIQAPCRCIVGENDSVTKNYAKKYREWGKYTGNGDVELHVIPKADHYFINSHAGELAEIIDSDAGLRGPHTPE